MMRMNLIQVLTGISIGCGRFFEGTPKEMHKALNEVLAGLPNDTKVYVSRACPPPRCDHYSFFFFQPGHEYTASNLKFGNTILQNAATKRLGSFLESNKQTQGKFTIGDEKEHNVFMRLDDPVVQKATGEKEPVEVMRRLREMKNNS